MNKKYHLYIMDNKISTEEQKSFGIDYDEIDNLKTENLLIDNKNSKNNIEILEESIKIKKKSFTNENIEGESKGSKSDNKLSDVEYKSSKSDNKLSDIEYKSSKSDNKLSDDEQKHKLLQKEIKEKKYKNKLNTTNKLNPINKLSPINKPSTINKLYNDFECNIKYKSGTSMFGVKWKKAILNYKTDEYLKISDEGKEYINLNISSIVILDGEYLCDKKKSFVIFENEIAHIILVEDDYDKVKELFSYINKKKNIDDVISSVSCIMEAYIFTDSSGNIIMINDLFEELTGHKKNEISGTNIKFIFKNMNSEKKNIYYLKESLKESSNVLIKKKNGDYFPFSVSIGEIQRDMFTYFIIIIKHVNSFDKNTEIVTIENLIKFGRITQLSKNKEFIEKLDKQTNEIYDWIYDKFISYDITMKLLLKNNKELEDIINEKNIEIEKYKSELDMLRGTKYEYKIFSIIRDEISYFFFLDFCKERYVEELPRFIHYVVKFIEKYNNTDINKNEMMEEAKQIYDTFIKNKSQFELNITDRLRDQIKIKIDSGDINHNLFNAVVSECILLLRDIYNEFDKTYIAKEIKNNSRTKEY
jgi:PAS domain S-box-containing protein